MKPNQTVQPTELACRAMRTFMPSHRGVTLSHPDQYKCVWVQWSHRRSKYLMADKFIQLADADKAGGYIEGF
jgi:hypothetical protein